MNATKTNRVPLLIGAVLAAWITAVVAGSVSGWLGSLSPYSPPFLAALSILVPSLAYFLVPSFKAYIQSVGLRRLTALHIFRILAVPLFFWYGRHNLLPRQFVEAAGWGDLAAGLLAMAVVFFWAKPGGYWTAHVLGMVDFITAFATAIRLTLAHPVSMHAITGLPMSLIPFFGVGVLATTHVIAYNLLSSNRFAVRRDLLSHDSLQVSTLQNNW